VSIYPPIYLSLCLSIQFQFDFEDSDQEEAVKQMVKSQPSFVPRPKEKKKGPDYSCFRTQLNQIINVHKMELFDTCFCLFWSNITCLRAEIVNCM